MLKINRTNGNEKNIKNVLISAAIITLYFNPNMADPFNAAKISLLIFFMIYIIPKLLVQTKNNRTKSSSIIASFFVLSLLWAFINSPSKYTALLGESQRQLGLITYIGFLIYFLFFIQYTTFDSIRFFQYIILVLSLLSAVYGYMQYFGKDFVNWINQYNPIIGTLGNPNFSSAFMAILATLNFSFIFLLQNRKHIKFFNTLIGFGLLILIYLTNATQGVLSFLAGMSIFVIVLAFNKNKFFGYSGIFVGVIGFILIMSGIFQKGPLANYIYKESVSLRGFYWRAGIQMLKEQPLTGVGLDHYGFYFKSAREAAYPLKYGYELTSTNAHNVIIQFFATGGVLLGIAYLSIIGLVIYCAIKGMLIGSEAERIIIGCFFSGWVAFLVQQTVSIDNLGLTIWGWILSGAIVGLYGNLKLNESYLKNKVNIDLKKANNALIFQLTSYLGIIIAGILVVLLTRAEFDVSKLRNEQNLGSPQNINVLKYYADRIAKNSLAQPIYKMQAADTYIRIGNVDQGVLLAQRISANSPGNPMLQVPLASFLESNRFFSQAILVRTELAVSDPQNLDNYLQLSRLYIEIGDFSNSQKMKQKIVDLAPNSEQAKSIISEIRIK